MSRLKLHQNGLFFHFVTDPLNHCGSFNIFWGQAGSQELQSQWAPHSVKWNEMNALNRLLCDLPWTFPNASHLPPYDRPPQTLFTTRRPQFPLPLSAPSSSFTDRKLVKSYCAQSEMNVHGFNVFIMVDAYLICPVFLSAQALHFHLTG